MSSKRSGNWPLRAACAAVLLVSQASLAEPALEEVIVTAQRREQNLQETPISIAAFGEDEIERRRITNIADLAAIVPNLRIVPFAISDDLAHLHPRRRRGRQPGHAGPAGRHLPERCYGAARRPDARHGRHRTRRGAARPAGHALRSQHDSAERSTSSRRSPGQA